MTNSDEQLRTIQKFVKAGVQMGKVYVEQERAMFDQNDNHSCYSEGWAHGFLRAMKTIDRFINDTIGDTNA